MYVMKYEGVAGNWPDVATVGSYLAKFDPDAHAGIGEVIWTQDLSKAIAFESLDAGWELWRATSTVQPTRADGKPNRPLTAFNVTIEKAPA